METKANYLAIGAATLAGFLGLIAFFVWFAQVQLDRTFARYDILFDNVSGLSQAGEVRFNGLLVGQVLSIGLADDGSGRVRVSVEVEAATPVRTDTRAQLQSQGVTGVSFVALTGGTPDLPLLADTVDGVPVIAGDRGTLETLVEDAPNLLAEARALIDDVGRFVSPENQANVTAILGNLANASGELEQALADFGSVSEAFATGTQQITAFTGQLESLAQSMEGSLGKLDATLDVGSRTLAEAEQTFARATATLGTAEAVIVGIGEVVDIDVPRIVDRADRTLGTLDDAIAGTQGDITATLAQVSAAAQAGTARLNDLQATITALNGTLATADTALVA
ncbi:MAG: MlaD family protein, partial [Rhodobacteraceae bacterium]|nr:MlaD family protein [Paracoccaceae bacterium]